MCDLKERNVSFAFVIPFPAFWNVGLLTGALASKLDYEAACRMGSLCEGREEERRGVLRLFSQPLSLMNTGCDGLQST